MGGLGRAADDPSERVRLQATLTASALDSPAALPTATVRVADLLP